MRTAQTKPGTLVLSPVALGVLGLILTAIAVAQQYVIDTSTGVHTVIVVITTTLGALGATRADAAALGRLIPPGIAVYLVTVVNVGQAIQGLSDIGKTAHAVISGALVLITSVMVMPDHTVESDPTASRSRL